MGTRRKTALGAAAAIVGTCFAGSIALANGGGERLKAEMDGNQEVPAADPDGTGKSRVQLHVDGGEVCFSFKYRDVGTPNRGHIHRGDAGVNGGIVVAFFDLQNAADNRDPRHDDLEDGKFEGCVTLVGQDALLAEIAQFPERFYVNLHNARFPGGAIRGQLED